MKYYELCSMDSWIYLSIRNSGHGHAVSCSAPAHGSPKTFPKRWSRSQGKLLTRFGQVMSSLPTNLCLDVNKTKLRILRMVIAKFCACETFVRFHHNATIAPKTSKC